MTPKDGVRAMLRKEATDRKELVRSMLRKEATDRKELVRSMLRKEAGLKPKVEGGRQLFDTVGDLISKRVRQTKWGKMRRGVPVAAETARDKAWAKLRKIREGLRSSGHTITRPGKAPAPTVPHTPMHTKLPTDPGLIRKALGGVKAGVKRAGPATLDFAKRNPKKSGLLGLTTAGAATQYARSGGDEPTGAKTMPGPTENEYAASRADKAAKAEKANDPGDRPYKPDHTKKPKSSDLVAGVPDVALAGAGGALVGGVGGYHAAGALGLDKMTGAIGGGVLTAIAFAILANKMKATA